MVVFGYIATLIMGVALGLLGGGGSILTVPILVYVFKIDAVSATAYSLFIVGLATAVGAIGKWRDQLIDFKVGASFALPGFLGVFIARAFVIPSLPETIIETNWLTLSKDMLILVTFAVMMILAAASMIKGRKETRTTHKAHSMNYWLIALEGLIVGGLTGFVGAGGGFLIIPALVILAKLPMKTAVGTSLLIIAFKSLFGFIGDVLVNPDIEWGFLMLLSIISIVGIFIGSQLSKLVSEQKLKKGFGYFVLIMGTFILAQQLYS